MEEKKKCNYLNDYGMCSKSRRLVRCKPTTIDFCDEPVEIIEADQICANCSIWGNSGIYITKEQLQDLLNGKVAYYSDGEYGTFITVKE